MTKPKIIFMGTPVFAIKALEALINNCEVLAVITMPSRPVGRKKIIAPTPINVLATKHNIPVFTPEKIASLTTTIQNLNPDFIVSCAYGQIIPEDILTIPKYFSLNIHASLLPKYRGAAPIQRAIMAGESETGITIMEMAAGLDTGDIFAIETIKITDQDTYQTIHDQLSEMGSKLIVKTIFNIINNQYQKIPQVGHAATYAYKITKADEEIDFNNHTMLIFNQIRALNPNPGAFSPDLSMKIYDVSYEIIDHQLPPGRMVTGSDLRITTQDGYIIVKSLKLPNRGLISATDYLNQIK